MLWQSRGFKERLTWTGTVIVLVHNYVLVDSCCRVFTLGHRCLAHVALVWRRDSLTVRPMLRTSVLFLLLRKLL